ncbi:MAG: hypothetical protein JST00_10385 [Deltaproteobacteria bacterium]|nr:hypothetical protein [Deltaproteobacteria bacterium]
MQHGYGPGFGGPPGMGGPGGVGASPGVRICVGCGVIAPTIRTSCNVCQAPFPPQPVHAAGRAGMPPCVLVCVHAADFACKACGIRSPLATLDCMGEAECMGCGLRQAFDVVQWTDAMTFAHGVGDLSGNSIDPIAARSRHAKIGSEYTSSTKTQNAMIMDGSGTRTHSLKTSVSPGHPVCKTCHVPLEIVLEGPSVKTRCPSCNDTAVYGMPPGATQAYGPLRGVIANEQRTDRPVAKLGRTQAGVESIVCPQCGAGINAGAGSELEKCTYCGLAVRIPGTLARQQRRGAVPKMDPFWLLFEGPSVGRQRLTRGKAEDPDDDDDDDDDDFASSPGVPFAGQLGPGGPGFVVVPPGAQSPHDPYRAGPMAYGAVAPAKSGGSGVIIAVVVLGLFLLLAAGAGVAFYMLSAGDDEPPPATTPAKPTKPARKK